MRITLFISVILMCIKFIAFFLTHSNAVLTDALESIINVVAGSFALYSIYYASRPKDEDHPYGHGKIEYISAGFEGGLILIAGLSIIAKSLYDCFIPREINSLDTGALLTAIAGAVNFLMGLYLIKIGKKYNSVLMIADGKHLMSDTVSSIGLVAGLIIMYLTNIFWIDNILAVAFGAFILYMGCRLIKESVTSLLDEADYEKLRTIISILNRNRRTKWIDMHNLRILKYGGCVHVDCHITLPWFESLADMHKEVKEVEKLVKKYMEGEMEFFIHSDPCSPDSCPVCNIENCKERKQPFIKTLEWTMNNLLPDKTHGLTGGKDEK